MSPVLLDAPGVEMIALRAITCAVSADVFAAPSTLTVSEWADRYRRLPSTAAEPGRFRTDRLPYMRAIQDALADETIRQVVFMKSAQVGGTTVGENYIGYLMDVDPCGVLSVWPTQKKLRSWSQKSLRPLIEETPQLAAKFPTSARRDAKDTIEAKIFPGGFLQLLTAKSSADLRSTFARVIIAEELDEWDDAIKDQGDPLEQLRARNRTFWNRKEYDVSTPILAGFSRIWREWERSTQQHYHVPCPHCNAMQALRWRDGEDDDAEASEYRFLFERDAEGEIVPGSTCYVCEACGTLIEERYKASMLEAGDWFATYPDRAVLGFHIWTGYSPLVAWDDLARAFLRAKDSPATLQTFVNLWLGLPFKGAGQRIEAHALQARAEHYAAAVPRGVGLVTAGVDVQGDHLELLLVGWGVHEESWILSWESFEGDPGQQSVWALLRERLTAPLRHESGAPVPISAVAIDAGYQSERVHRFCHAMGRANVFATVGRRGRGPELLKAPGPQKRKRTGKAHRPTHVLYVDSGKDLLASRLRTVLREDGTVPPGYVHFSDALTTVFFDQLTAEQLITVYSSGRVKREWRLVEGRRNEALDLAILNMGALAKLGRETIARLGSLASELDAWSADAAPATRLVRTRRVRSRGVL